jgi:BON domain
MNDIFGTASPMWGALPSAGAGGWSGVGFQIPGPFGARPIGAPQFGSPAHSIGISNSSSGVPGLSASNSFPPNAYPSSQLPGTMYGFGGVVPPNAQQSLGAPAVMTAGLPYAFNPSGGFITPEALGWIPPAALLAAVAIRRGQPQGPTNDREVEDLIYDALEMLPGANDVEVRVENGRATLTGSVPDKRTKRDIGEIVWAIPSSTDVQNNITITSRRRSRPNREAETTTANVPARKQS